MKVLVAFLSVAIFASRSCVEASDAICSTCTLNGEGGAAANSLLDLGRSYNFRVIPVGGAEESARDDSCIRNVLLDSICSGYKCRSPDQESQSEQVFDNLAIEGPRHFHAPRFEEAC